MVKVSEIVGDSNTARRNSLTTKWIKAGLALLVPSLLSSAFVFPQVLNLVTSGLFQIENRLLYVALAGAVANFVMIALVYQYFYIEGRIAECASLLSFVLFSQILIFAGYGDNMSLFEIECLVVAGKFIAAFILYTKARPQLSLGSAFAKRLFANGLLVFVLGWLGMSNLLTQWLSFTLSLLITVFFWLRLNQG